MKRLRNLLFRPLYKLIDIITFDQYRIYNLLPLVLRTWVDSTRDRISPWYGRGKKITYTSVHDMMMDSALPTNVKEEVLDSIITNDKVD